MLASDLALSRASRIAAELGYTTQGRKTPVVHSYRQGNWHDPAVAGSHDRRDTTPTGSGSLSR